LHLECITGEEVIAQVLDNGLDLPWPDVLTIFFKRNNCWDGIVCRAFDFMREKLDTVLQSSDAGRQMITRFTFCFMLVLGEAVPEFVFPAPYETRD
jgi:hypothetical protein